MSSSFQSSRSLLVSRSKVGACREWWLCSSSIFIKFYLIYTKSYWWISIMRKIEHPWETTCRQPERTKEAWAHQERCRIRLINNNSIAIAKDNSSKAKKPSSPHSSDPNPYTTNVLVLNMPNQKILLLSVSTSQIPPINSKWIINLLHHHSNFLYSTFHSPIHPNQLSQLSLPLTNHYHVSKTLIYTNNHITHLPIFLSFVHYKTNSNGQFNFSAQFQHSPTYNHITRYFNSKFPLNE